MLLLVYLQFLLCHTLYFWRKPWLHLFGKRIISCEELFLHLSRTVKFWERMLPPQTETVLGETTQPLETVQIIPMHTTNALQHVDYIYLLNNMHIYIFFKSNCFVLFLEKNICLIWGLTNICLWEVGLAHIIIPPFFFLFFFGNNPLT